MALDFPASPTGGQTFTSGTTSWRWDGTKWIHPSLVATDPYFSSVVGLWHFDGTNGATTFADSSTKGHTLTGSANYTLSTAQQKFGTGSLNIAGNGTAANATDSADWDFGSGEFTIEMWVRTPAISSTDVVISQWGASPSNTYNFRLRFDNGGNFAFDYCPTGAFASIVTITGLYAPPANTWVHIAVDRDASNVLRLYADGVVKASATAASAFFNSSQVLAVGNTNDGASRFLGNIDDVRITKGVARYHGAFTPPTAAFPDA